MNEEKILKKLNQHDKQFDKHQVILENLVAKALQHDDEFVKVREEIKHSKEEILSAIDGIAGRFSVLEAESVATTAILDRHQDEINSRTKDITKIKKTLKLAN